MNRRKTLAALAIFAVLSAATVAWSLRRDPVHRVVSAAGRQRTIEARLSGGFAWAPLQQRTRGQSLAATLDGRSHFRGDWQTLAAIALDPSGDNKRAAAMAVLLAGDRSHAVERFQTLAAENPHDVNVWSDLAAARYELGVAEGDASLVAGALAAADAALRLDDSLPEALFNRAVAIERLGIRDEARKAWTRFLQIDGTTEWADEGRERIRHLPPIPYFMVDLQKYYPRLASDPEFAHRIARERPGETRLYSETVILADWATAAQAGDTEAAARHLRVVREFGSALARNRGECMVQRAVRAVDEADEERRQHLIRGHLLFRKGQNEFKTDHAADAQETFTRAVDELAKGGSPVRLLAEYFLAHTFHSLGDLPEARRRELRLLADAPPEFPAYRAQLLWNIGLGYQSDGDWGKALDAFSRSVAIFDDLGEADYAAIVRELTAEVHDRNGDPEEAWRQRVISLRGIGRMTTARLTMALDNVGRGAMFRKEWPVALSFLKMAGDTAEAIDRPTIETEALLLQARALAHTGDRDAARATIVRARLATARIDDTEAQREALANVDRTEALVASSPEVAVALLTRSIDYHATRGRRVILPDLLLLRGRAYRNLGQRALAAADFEAGIAEVEQHRETLPAGDSRWGTFDPITELFEEAVASTIQSGDAAAALAYAERSRARELLDTLGASVPGAVPTSIAHDTAVVEYFSLPDRLVIFVVRRGAIHVAEERIDRMGLERAADEFRGALAAASPRHRSVGELLYRRLIAPIASEIEGSETLVFVPGPRFPSIAFAALPAGTGYLIQRHTIVVAPSVAVFSRLAARKGGAAPRRSVLVVANPNTGNAAALAGSESEADDVARLYSQSRQLLRADATVQAYRRYAPSADVIHIATHGTTEMTSRGGGALLLSDGRLDSQTIGSIALPRTRAVVLAACDSARGPARAEGTISAARGFLAAGVPAVVATLWEIDDRQAAEFFPRVHRELAHGAAAAAAVRKAQIESIERRQPPALWAAIQCIGTDGE